MVKAVFIDYIGTTVDEHSSEMAEIVRRICKNSNLHDPRQALRHNELKAAGVVSADTARVYKPHREIFDEALKSSGCTPDEVVHIGDSYDTDVVGARGAGIRPVLLLRGRERLHYDVDTADGLEQALELVLPKG